MKSEDTEPIGAVMTVSVTAVFHPHVGARDDLIAALRESIPAVHE